MKLPAWNLTNVISGIAGATVSTLLICVLLLATWKEPAASIIKGEFRADRVAVVRPGDWFAAPESGNECSWLPRLFQAPIHISDAASPGK